MQQWEYTRIFVYENTVLYKRSVGESVRVKDTLRGALRDLLSVEEPDRRERDHRVPVNEVLARLGTEGWELTGVAGGTDQFTYQLFFKRPKP